MGLETAFVIEQVGLDIKRIADIFTLAQHGAIDVLPGLQQYWLGGSRRETGQLPDHGGAGSALSEVGSCPTGFDGNAFVHVGNGTNYLTGGGIVGVTGLETWISSSIRGLTVGAWVMVDVAVVQTRGIITKDTLAPGRGYALYRSQTGQFGIHISGNGAATLHATSVPYGTGIWQFVVGRFIPSTEVAVIVDGEKTVNTTAVPSSINVSTADFELGRYEQTTARILSGKLRDIFVCASALTDEQIENVRQSTHPGS